MDLLTIFRVLYRRIWYLVGIPLLAVIIAFLLTAGYPKIYRSTGQLATGFTVTKEINLTGEGFNVYESGVKFNNLIETINSIRVLSLVSYKLLIHDLSSGEGEAFTNLDLENENDIEFVNSLDLEWVKTFCQNKLDSMKMMNTYYATEKDVLRLMELYEYDFESLKSKVFVRRVNNTDYVSVDSFTENPLLSAYIANTVCSEFLRFNSNIINSNKQDAIETYAKLVTEKRAELATATSRLQSFKARNSIINSELERENIVTRISDIETELKDEKQKLRAKNVQLEEINRRLSGVTSSGITNTDVIRIRNQISEMNDRYQRTGSRVLSDSLEILRETQRRYIQMISEGSFNRSYDEMMDERSDLEVEIDIIKGNISDLEDIIARSGSVIGGYASKESRLASLEREVNLASEDYRDAQENYSLALSYSVSAGNSISQILLALPASEAEPSKRLIVSAISGISTFVFFVLAIVLLEYLDASIRSAANFVDKTNMTLLGSLNHINNQDFKNVFDDKAIKSEIPKKKLIDRISLVNKSKVANLNDTVVFKEQLRKIRYNLLDKGKKVILFTSTKEGEGKTSLITALAASLNKSQLRTLIIDTNFGNPSLTKKMKGLPILEGIFQNKKESKTEVSKDFISMFANNTDLPYVDIFGCKGGAHTPLEIIKGNSLRSLIDDVREKYDFILFEGMALNTNSGSRELSSYVDGVVTVFSAKSVLGQLDYDSIEFIESLGEKNLGAILNDVELDDMKS